MNLAKLGFDILPYVLTIVLGILGYASRHLGPYLKEKLGEKRLSNAAKDLEIAEQQIRQKKGIANDAVRWAADAFKSLGGLERLSKAINWALNEGKKVGIDATKEQWEAAIRIAYTELKPQLNYAVSSVLGFSSDKESETKTEDNSAEDPENEQTPPPADPPKPPKPVTEMTSSDIKDIVTQVFQGQLQAQTITQPTHAPAAVQ